ncbi:MAG: MBL fold metallo-hydrolase [Thermanaeromonas sp.]|uniref:MBL fold metallo-hydrolase n=1 Tax=Thermanaeromonas sp. TaxID=2003697 RepID=UPI00243E77BB|nr:MBL fold metallo-hydrolase [Thermanaeromonas sp.]MCG0278426.1 MBL fold metallo-hydrolase [Thermanaeromonas sp.]
MKLIILGCYTPYPPAGGACPGYLLEGERTRVLLEFGSGVMSRLQEFIPFWELDAVVLSHLHGDHMSDLGVYRYAIDQAVMERKRIKPVPVWAPPEPADIFATLPYKEALEGRQIEPGRDITIGEFSFTFVSTRHAFTCMAMRITDGNKTLVYTGDTEYFSDLIGFAQGADLLLAEATYVNKDLELGATGHLSAGQAARIARDAEVKRLILTHLRSWYERTDLLREAKSLFPNCQVAVERAIVEI